MISKLKVGGYVYVDNPEFTQMFIDRYRKLKE